MKLCLRKAGIILCSLLLVLITGTVHAQEEQPASGPPPIATPLVRQGAFAVKLVFELGIGTTDDELAAEERLAEVGILPRNGWIADYPVTPDVIGELQQAVNDAADSGKISLSKDEALERFNKTLSESGLSMTPYSPEANNGAAPAGAENYPNPSVVNNYYYNQGPPVVTPYTPPPDFYYMYSWVPYPFWWSSFWFPGFFILHDFHRTIIVDRRVFVISNHFRDVRVNRVFRIDPVSRFHGKTFGGIGGSRIRGLFPTGIPGSERRIFNRPRNLPGGVVVEPPASRGGRVLRTPSRGGVIVTPPPARGGESVRPPVRDGRGSPALPGGERVRPPSSRGSGGSPGRGQRR